MNTGTDLETRDPDGEVQTRQQPKVASEEATESVCLGEPFRVLRANLNWDFKRPPKSERSEEKR